MGNTATGPGQLGIQASGAVVTSEYDESLPLIIPDYTGGPVDGGHTLDVPAGQTLSFASGSVIKGQATSGCARTPRSPSKAPSMRWRGRESHHLHLDQRQLRGRRHRNGQPCCG